jgi:hypothetical protein
MKSYGLHRVGRTIGVPVALSMTMLSRRRRLGGDLGFNFSGILSPCDRPKREDVHCSLRSVPFIVR